MQSVEMVTWVRHMEDSYLGYISNNYVLPWNGVSLPAAELFPDGATEVNEPMKTWLTDNLLIINRSVDMKERKPFPKQQ